MYLGFSRYQFITSPTGALYRLDMKTGEGWYANGNYWIPLLEQE